MSRMLFLSLGLLLAAPTPRAAAAGVDAAALDAALTLWPEADRKALARSVALAAAGRAAPYAVFDADGTLWSSDATEAFIAYLEARGLLATARLPPELKVIPPLEGEGVYGYYRRLCEIDKALGYPFAAQVFAGFSLAELRGYYAEMMRTPGSTVRVRKDGAFADEFVAAPRLYPRQRQLVAALRAGGVEVYVVTASPEELVRFLASSPSCGEGFDLDLPPENVIGVNLLLRDDGTGEVTSSRLRIARAGRLYDAANTRARRERLRLTTFVLPPVTMQAGKVAAIASFIDPALPPVLAAGDSSGDLPMLFYSAGARLWVGHSYTDPAALPEALAKYRLSAAPDRGWVRADLDAVK